MKESEFIELLNLYVDHELASADAARLEAEVARNPERARIYREYCGMQKACMILADKFRGDAPAPGAETIATAAAPSHRGWGLPFASAGLAAAACLAAVLLLRHGMVPAHGPAPAQLAQVDAPASRSIAPAAAPASLDAGLQSLFNVRLEAATPQKSGATALLPAAATQDSFAWMNQVQLMPIQRVPIGSLLFEPKTTLEPQNRGFNSSQSTLQGPVEMAAFRLQLDK